MVLVKYLKFWNFLFFRSNTPKKVFHDVLHRKLAFLDDKNVELKKFLGKGLVHGFGQKFPFLFSVFFYINRPTKVFHDVLDRKLAFFDVQNIDLKKGQNLHFSKGFMGQGSMVLVKNLNFFYSLFFISNTPIKSLVTC